MKGFISAFILMLSSAAHAGWTSTGGSLIQDKNNPWFLKDVETVSYCIVADSKNFDASIDVIDQAIERAVRYWREEFAVAPSQQFKFSIPKFIRSDCSDKTDVAFRFGVLPENMTAKDREYLGDTTQFVSLAVRTEYDSSSMRGRGFVYVSPRQGPLGYVHGTDDADGLPWAYGESGQLIKVLIHEVGHIFGITHTGSAPTNVMAEDYPDYVIRHAGAQSHAEDMPRFINFTKDLSSTYVGDRNNGDIKKLFGTFKNTFTVKYRDSQHLDVWEVDDQGRLSTWMGAITMAHVQSERLPALRVFMPKGQTQFPEFKNESVDGPLLTTRISALGQFHARNGRDSMPIFVNILPNEIQIATFIGNHIYMNLLKGK